MTENTIKTKRLPPEVEHLGGIVRYFEPHILRVSILLAVLLFAFTFISAIKLELGFAAWMVGVVFLVIVVVPSVVKEQKALNSNAILFERGFYAEQAISLVQHESTCYEWGNIKSIELVSSKPWRTKSDFGYSVLTAELIVVDKKQRETIYRPDGFLQGTLFQDFCVAVAQGFTEHHLPGFIERVKMNQTIQFGPHLRLTNQGIRFNTAIAVGEPHSQPASSLHNAMPLTFKTVKWTDIEAVKVYYTDTLTGYPTEVELSFSDEKPVMLSTRSMPNALLATELIRHFADIKTISPERVQNQGVV